MRSQPGHPGRISSVRDPGRTPCPVGRDHASRDLDRDRSRPSPLSRVTALSTTHQLPTEQAHDPCQPGMCVNVIAMKRITAGKRQATGRLWAALLYVAAVVYGVTAPAYGATSEHGRTPSAAVSPTSAPAPGIHPMPPGAGADRVPTEAAHIEARGPDGGRAWPVTGTHGARRPAVPRGWDPPPEPWATGHRGVDLAAGPGQPVRAAAPGRVSFAGKVAGRGVVSIELSGTGRPPLRTTYEPVRPTAHVGDRVQAGEKVGVLGLGGHCSESCLHWGLLRGEDYRDPLSLLPPGLLGTDHTRLLPVYGVPVPGGGPGARPLTPARSSASASGPSPDAAPWIVLPPLVLGTLWAHRRLTTAVAPRRNRVGVRGRTWGRGKVRGRGRGGPAPTARCRRAAAARPHWWSRPRAAICGSVPNRRSAAREGSPRARRRDGRPRSAHRSDGSHRPVGDAPLGQREHRPGS